MIEQTLGESAMVTHSSRSGLQPAKKSVKKKPALAAEEPIGSTAKLEMDLSLGKLKFLQNLTPTSDFHDGFTDGGTWRDTFGQGGTWISSFNNLMTADALIHPAVRTALEQIRTAIDETLANATTAAATPASKSTSRSAK